MTKTLHKRTAVASMFQNGISQNTRCAERDGFRREGHIYIIIMMCKVCYCICSTWFLDIRISTCFLYLYLWWQKNGTTRSGHARQGKPWRKACSVCELARLSIGNCSRSMKIATFSTRDLQEQCCNSYVTSYRVKEEFVIWRMFSHKLHQWRWFAKVSSVNDSQYTVHALNILFTE